VFARGVGGDALCATLYAGGCGGWALFVGGVRGAVGARGYALSLTLLAGGAGGTGGYALCLTLLAGGAGGAGCHALGASLYARCCGGWVGFGLSFGVSKFPSWQFSRYSPPHICSKA